MKTGPSLELSKLLIQRGRLSRLSSSPFFPCSDWSVSSCTLVQADGRQSHYSHVTALSGHCPQSFMCSLQLTFLHSLSVSQSSSSPDSSSESSPALSRSQALNWFKSPVFQTILAAARQPFLVFSRSGRRVCSGSRPALWKHSRRSSVHLSHLSRTWSTIMSSWVSQSVMRGFSQPGTFLWLRKALNPIFPILSWIASDDHAYGIFASLWRVSSLGLGYMALLCVAPSLNLLLILI